MSRPNFRRRKFRAPRIRTNERIRVREVRVVDAEGSQVGVMPTEKAIQMARAHGLDLVERGHRRLPTPPAKIIGRNFIFLGFNAPNVPTT